MFCKRVNWRLSAIDTCGERGLSSRARVVRARYEGGVLRPLEPLQLEEGEEVLVRVERLENRERIVEEFYGKRGPAPKELLDEFMLEAEAQ